MGEARAVLHEALVRDEMSRCGGRVRKGHVRQEVKAFIQNVHHFRDDGVRNPAVRATSSDHVDAVIQIGARVGVREGSS
jgi:hypothetical protein